MKMGFFQDLLFSLGYYKGVKYWNYDELHRALLSSQDAFALPYRRLPQYITMHSSFWEKIKEVRDYTRTDGHEYALSVWYADGELFTTPPFRGDVDSVQTNYHITLKYLPADGQYATKVVDVNGSPVIQHNVLMSDIPSERDISVLFHLHTHPPYPSGEYSFFSAVDIQHLLQGTFFITGIITDTCYLLLKSADTPHSGNFSDKDITIEYLTRELRIGVYRANESQAVFERLQDIV